MSIEPISLVDPSLWGDSGNGASGFDAINVPGATAKWVSADGQRVAFHSSAKNLTLDNSPFGETNIDVFVSDINAGTTTLVSARSPGSTHVGTRGDSANPVLSANGRYVAFESFGNDLVDNFVKGSGTFSDDIFIRDLEAGVTRLVSANRFGTASADNTSILYDISDDGRYVLFQSLATDLVPNDTNGNYDFFVRDVAAGTTVAVSVDQNGVPVSGLTLYTPAALSGDGRYVAFVSSNANIVAGDGNGTSDVFVRDLQTGSTTLVSIGAAGEVGNAASGHGVARQSLAISPDGRFVGFFSAATNLISSFNNLNGTAADLFLRDMQLGTTTLVTVNATGTGGGNRGSVRYEVAMTADGQQLAFTSAASTLVTGVTYPTQNDNVFVRNVQSGSTQLTSVNAAGTAAASSAFSPMISDNGRYVSFASADGTLATVDANGLADVFIRDLETNTTILASRNAAGTAAGNLASAPSAPSRVSPALSRNGATLVYSSLASDLAANDNNRKEDVFAFHLGNATNTLVSARATEIPSAYTGNNFSVPTAMSADGRYVLLDSRASNLNISRARLTPFSDVFLHDRQTNANILISENTAGTGGANSATSAFSRSLMTPDARYVLFDSYATNLVSGFTLDAGPQLYRRDVLTGTTALVSVNAGGTGGVNSAITDFAISGNGRYVAFITQASDAVSDFTSPGDSVASLYVRDMETGVTTLVAHRVTNAQLHEPHVFSHDGRFLTFISQANDLVAGDENDRDDVFVYDRVTDSIQLVSVNAAGTGSGSDESNYPQITADGRYVVFYSWAADLPPGYVPDDSGYGAIYVRDLAAQTTSLVAGGEVDWDFAVSGDGHYVVYLHVDQQTFRSQVVLRDLQSEIITLVSVNVAGTGGGNGSSTERPAVSNDGRFVAFLSRASDLVSGFVDNNSFGSDVFIRDLLTNTTWLASPSATGPGGANRSEIGEPLFLSEDGQVLVYGTDATNLSLADRNGQIDAYAFTVPGEITPRPDLGTSIVSVSAAGVVGGTIELNWRVRNVGTADAAGDWQDAVYLSRSPLLDASTVLLGVFPRSGGLIAGGGYEVSANVALPAELTGEYFVVVQTDRRNQLAADVAKGNNISASDPILVSVPQLSVGIPYEDEFTGAGQNRYYQISVAPGQSLRLVLDSAAAAGGTELYVRRDQFPTLWNYDFASRFAGRPDQALTVPLTEPGVYYVLAISRFGAAATSAFTVTANLNVFALDWVDLSSAGNVGRATVGVHGAGFTQGTRFELVGPGGTISSAEPRLDHVALAFAAFDLTGATPGVYDLRAISPLGEVLVLANAFTVETGVGARVTTELIGPPLVRSGRTQPFYVIYRNDGDVDIIAPLLSVHSPTNTPMGLSPEDVFPARNVTFLGVNTSGFAGVLPPGAEVHVPVYFQVPVLAGPDFDFELFIVHADNDTPLDWAEVEASISPTFTSAANWPAIQAQFRQQIGTTWGDYVRMLARNASLLADTGPGVQPVRLIDLEVRKAVAALGNSLEGTLISNGPVAGRTVVATSLTGWEKYVTTSLNDGSFLFEKVVTGIYELSVDKAIVVSGAPVSVAQNAVVKDVSLQIIGATRVRGALTIAETSAAVPFASVLLVDADGRQFSTTTDGSGRYSIDGVPAGTYTLLANAPGRARTRIENVLVGDDPLELDVPMEKEAVLRGTVNLAPGGPTGSSLEITARLQGDSGQAPFSTTVAGPDFSISRLPAGTYDVHIRRAGYAATVVRDVVVTAGGTVDLAAVTLGRGAMVSGRIVSTDPDFSPAYQQVGLLRNGLVFASSRTNGLGEFLFTDITPGDWEAMVLGVAGVTDALPLSLATAEHRTDVTLNVRLGASVVGQVTNSFGGAPLGGVQVELELLDGEILFAETDDNGMYRFDRLAAGAYEVSLTVRGAGEPVIVSVSGNDGDEATADLVAEVQGGIRGRVLLGTGEPAFAGVVRLLQDGFLIASVNTDANGEYGFDLTEPGSYRLVAHVAAASYAPVDVDVVAGETVTRDFSPGTGMISVQVTGATPGTNVSIAVDLPSGRELAGSAAVSAAGTAVFPNLAAGDYTIVAIADGNRGAEAAVTLATGQSLNVPLTLAQQHTLSGTVTSASGAPLRHAWVTLSSTSGVPIQQTTVTGADGKFFIDYVAPGVYDLVVYRDGSTPVVQTGVSIGGSFSTGISLPDSTSEITGKVVNVSGKPIPRAVIVLVDTSGRIVGNASAAQDGTFRISAPTGEFSIEVTALGYIPAAVNDIVVPAGGGVDLGNVALRPKALVKGGPEPIKLPSFEIPNFPPPPPPPPPEAPPMSGPNETHDPEGGKEAPKTPKQPPQEKQNNNPNPPTGPQTPQPETPPTKPDPPPSDPDCPDPCEQLYQQLSSLIDTITQTIAQHDQKAEELGKRLLEYIGTVARESTDWFNKLLSAFGVKNPLGIISDAYKTITNVGKAIDAVSHARTPQDIEAAWKAAKAETSALISGLKAGNKIKDGKLTPSLTLESINKNGKAGYLDQLSQLNSLMDLLEKAMKGESPYKDSEKLGEELKTTGAELANLRQRLQTLKAQYERLLTDYNNCRQNHQDDCHEPPPDPFGDKDKDYKGSGRTAIDPNEIVGPGGFGESQWIAPQAPLPYTIYFENDPEKASAPAQEVYITHQLDTDLDWSTFELKDFGFGALVVTPPAGVQAYETRIEYHNEDGSPLLVDVSAQLDLETGIVTWAFLSIDPETGTFPPGVFDGFLPVNDETGRGEGFVSFLVSPKTELPTGTTIDQQASIVFDFNEPLVTNTFTNTIDAGPPASSVSPLPATTHSRTFTVSWSGGDDLGGSGIATFDVFVSVDGGAFALFQDDTAETSATFTGEFGHSYRFYSVATDNVGHSEAAPLVADAQTALSPPRDLLVVGADAGGGPHVRVLDPLTLQERFSFFAYDPAFSGGVRVATGDINGDGTPDIITAAGPGGGPHVRVFDGLSGVPLGGNLGSFFAYNAGFTGGVFVASADVNGDDRDDIITGAGSGGGPHVRVFSGLDGAELFGFFAYNSGFTGGVAVAAGDVDDDGRADIITGAGPGGGPHVRVLSGLDGRELSGFYAYNSGFQGGVFVSAGDVDGDGHWDVYTGAGAGGGPHVKVISGSTGEDLWSFYAYAADFAGGVRVAAGDLDGDQLADILTAAGPGGGPHVRGLGGVSLTEIAGFFAYNAGFGGGVLVAAHVVEPADTALRLAGDPHPKIEPMEQLTSDRLELLRVAAIARWESAGFDRSERLSGVELEVAELPENVLGDAVGRRVLIDQDAAGAGWFIDLTPDQDEEYSLAGSALSSGARQRVDLLTVVLHELGHTLGLGHNAQNPEDLMQDLLTPGVRRLPTPRLVDALFSK